MLNRLAETALGFVTRRVVLQSNHEIGRWHHSDDRAPMRPPHGRNAGNAGSVALFDERINRRRKPAFAPGGFHVRSSDAEAFGDRDDRLAFRDIGVFGKERARNVVIEDAGRGVVLFGAHELGRLECETRVDVTFRRVDWKPDLSTKTFEPRANLRPVFRTKRLRRPFGWRLRMNFEGKPT